MLGLHQRLHVDDVKSARFSVDRDVYFPGTAGDREVLRWSREWNPLDFLQGLTVHHGHRLVPFNGDEDMTTIGRGYDAMALFDALDFADDSIRRRIDDADRIPCTVGLKDAHLQRLARDGHGQHNQSDP